MKLGDLIYYITYYTGIHWLVKKVSKLLGKDCGCDKRRKDLNDVFEGYLKYRVNTDEPVLCLELPQEPLDKYGECKRKIENLFR